MSAQTERGRRGVPPALTAKRWADGQDPSPVALDGVPGLDAPVHVDLSTYASADVDLVFSALGSALGGDLQKADLEVLLREDGPPDPNRTLEVERTRVVSTFAVLVVEGSGDTLRFVPVKLLCGARWLLTRWPAGPTSYDLRSLESDAAGMWKEQTADATGANLGLVFLHAIANSFTLGRRGLFSALDDWELHALDEAPRPTGIEQLVALRRRSILFRQRLEELNRPGMKNDRAKIWFQDGDPHEAERVDELVDRALRNLRAFGEAVRTAAALHTSLQAKRQSEDAAAFQWLATLAASVLLVPSLIATVFGANPLPVTRSWKGFVLMLALMTLGAAISYLLLEWRRRRHEGD